MAAEWEQQQRRGLVPRRLLLPLGLVLTGVLAGVVAMPTEGQSDFSVVPETGAEDEPAPARPIADEAAGGRWTTAGPGPLSARDGAVVVAAGDDVLVWGGEALRSRRPLADGALYDAVEDEWQPIPDAPIAGRAGAASVWTGSELVVWGGLGNGRALGDGAAYNPATRRWRRLPAAPLSPRFKATAVTTRGHLLIWGGTRRQGARAEADGAAYDLQRDRWTPIPRGPLPGLRARDIRALPTDDGMFVWSSDGADAAAALYDPRTRHWRELRTPRLDPEHPIVLTAVDGNVIAWGRATIASRGPLALVFTTSPDWWSTLAVPPFVPDPGQTLAGGRGMAVSWSDRGPGVMFDALVNRWVAITGPPRPAAVGYPSQVWTGERLFVWHGVAQPESRRRTLVWEPTSPWQEIPEAPVPLANRMSVLWSGWLREQQQVLIWGGVRDEVTNAGALYDPALQLWEAMPEAPIAGRSDHAAVFTGDRMLVLGGAGERGAPLRNAAAYLPLRRQWRRVPDLPMDVRSGGATWSGEAVFAAGEHDGATVVARLDARRNTWRTLPPPPAATRAGRNTWTLWTGFEVWVWTRGADGVARGAGWDPDRRRWRPLPSLRHHGELAAAWSGNRMYVVDQAGRTASLGRGTEGWRRHPTAPVAGERAEITWTGRRLALFVPTANRLASLDPRGGAWAETVTPPPSGRADSGQLLWTGRHLFVFGNGTAVVQGGQTEF